MGFLFFALLCSLSSALVFPDGASFPHFSEFTQLNLFENRNDLWNKSYGFAFVPACPPNRAAAPPGQVLMLLLYSELRGVCSMQEIVAEYSTVNPPAIMVVSGVCDIDAFTGTSPYLPVANDVPLIYAGQVWGNGKSIAENSLPQNIPFQLFAPNVTAILDYPYQNLSIQSTFVVGWLQVYFLNIVFGLVTMLLAMWKLSMFIHTNGLKFSIAQTVLALVFLSALWLFVFGGLTGVLGINNTKLSAGDIIEGFRFWFVGFTFSAVLIMGFYFGEIAVLTSAQTVPGLSKMKIPTAIFLCILWGVVLADAIVGGTDPGFTTGSGSSQLSDFIFAILAVVVPVLCTLVLGWGSFILVKAMGGSGNKSAILRVVCLSIVIILSYWCCAFLGFLVHYIPTGFNALAFFPHDPSGPELVGTIQILLTLGFTVINVALCLSFSISVQKEIEVSKSGTSSTSGSSSASSSSSSSSNDPVIEL